MGVAGLPVAPLFSGLAVFRVAFWCSGAVESLPRSSWQLARWCGTPGLATFDFRVLFLSNLDDLSFLGYVGLNLHLVSAGWSLPSESPGCGLSVGARRGRLLLGSLRLDDVGWKLVCSCRRLVCMDSVPATPNGDIGINLVDPASSHMLVSKIKPCMSQYKLLHGETANGSLKQLSFIW